MTRNITIEELIKELKDKLCNIYPNSQIESIGYDSQGNWVFYTDSTNPIRIAMRKEI